MEKKLESIAQHLLDLGKRNRLINYKDEGTKSLKILNSNTDVIFEDIVFGKAYSIYNCDDVLEKHAKELTNAETDSLHYSDEKVIRVLSPLIKEKNLMCYKKGIKLERLLKILMKDYKNSLTEKGINCLYISFGFIQYVEENKTYQAPLLLIPALFTNDKGTYKLKEYEDEVILNPTLEYYFQTMFKISLPKYTSEDIKLYDYFEEVKKVLPQDCQLIDASAIGVYSFVKMNMYNDLMTNKQVVLKNENILKLLGDKSLAPHEYSNLPVYPVVDCDSSQLAAITTACSGRSFVLEGPPGSGKSQTITNIIASLIANNKKVLFVSEKLAALKVVYENLRRSNLSDFAIELHSSKANKKEFIDELYRVTTLPKYKMNKNAENIYEDHDLDMNKLLTYRDEIHNVIPQYGVSLYELYSNYFNIEVEPIEKYKLDKALDLSFKDADEVSKLLVEYADSEKNLGYDYRKSVFYGFKEESMDYLRYEIDNDLINSANFAKKLENLAGKINDSLKLGVISVRDLYNSFDVLSILVKIKNYDADYLIKEKRDIILNLIKDYKDICASVDATTYKKYNKDILNENLDEALHNLNKYNASFFKFLNKKYKELYGNLVAYREKKISSKKLAQELSQLIDYKNKMIRLQGVMKRIEEIAHIERQDYNETEKILTSLNILPRDVVLPEEKFKELKPYFTDILIGFDAIKADDANLSKLASKFDGTVCNLYDISIHDVINKLNGILSEKDKLKDYMSLRALILKIKEYNQFKFLNDYLDLNLPLDEIADQFKKLYYQEVIYSIIDASPVLSGFTSNSYANLMSHFSDLDSKILKTNQDKVFAICSSYKPDDDVMVEGSPMSALIKEHNKTRKQKPIRLLINDIFELCLSLKPVFLMSPLSVSTYLESRLDMFDTVIFDEASQIFAWDALGAIYRAKQCIIIGDTKQMPPSAFFQALATDEDEDNYTDDQESILDTASAVFTSSRLKWHYRSRSEELITFSNNAFYDSSLITVPQAKPHEEGFGIDFYYLPNGRYDAHLRTNRAEAEYICDLVYKHVKTSKKSLGVVAFSNVQATLIDDIIEKRRMADKEFDALLDKETDEPFFVKNLETVQGDERDRIIFSICYGYNEENKFYQRFGPLNNLGGERRLNVAITRAKYNISVVSSIRYGDIKAQSTDSLGVKLLRDYLEFCENVTRKSEYFGTDDGVINSIKEFLQLSGYVALPLYGASSFKVDLAVKNPETGIFELAIMLDGNSDLSGNATEIYRMQKSLLERLGWKYIKVYSTSWLNNQASEQKRILDALKNKDEEVKPEAKKSEEKSFLVKDNTTETLEKHFKEYKATDIEKAKELYNFKGLSPALIQRIIKAEQPISEDYLCKIVANIMDKTRVTTTIKNAVNNTLAEIDVIRDGKFIMVDPLGETQLRIHSNRSFEDIYPGEIRYGIYTLVSLNNGITKEGCYKALVKLLGFERLTEANTKAFDDAVVFLKLDGKITERGESLFV